MKIHMYDCETEVNMPQDVKREFNRDGYKGAICGYMRQNTTTNPEKVTCFYCKKRLEAA